MSGSGPYPEPVTPLSPRTATPAADALRRRAQERIRAGTLPLQTPDRSWAGRGSGEACGVCGLPIEPTSPEYDLEFMSDSVPVLVRFHRVCLAMWELLRRGQ
jgi:hypothetical protein